MDLLVTLKNPLLTVGSRTLGFVTANLFLCEPLARLCRGTGSCTYNQSPHNRRFVLDKRVQFNIL